jgi:hypothetical protein
MDASGAISDDSWVAIGHPGGIKFGTYNPSSLPFLERIVKFEP